MNPIAALLRLDAIYTLAQASSHITDRMLDGRVTPADVIAVNLILADALRRIERERRKEMES